MTYHKIDAMQPGESVVLLVTATNPESDKWAKRTPVTVSRVPAGWLYESAYGMTATDIADAPETNPGHRGLNAHMKTLTGVPWPIESIRAADLIAREYRLIRRDLYARTPRTESDRYPESIYPERYGRRAAYALETARATIAGNKESRAPYASGASVWAGLGGSDGATFAHGGDSRCRWFERPESKGLRFLGLAHEVGKGGYSYTRDAVQHKGWYLDDDGGESICGVVYQLPGAKGRARYMFGYADPHNTDKEGRGPACLSLEVLEGDATDSNYDPDPVLRDAARRADSMAETYATNEREYQDGYRLGQKARGKTEAARNIGRAWVDACRDARALWTARHGCPALPGPIARNLCRDAIKTARNLQKQYRKERAKARAWRAENTPGRRDTCGLDGFKCGYMEGAE